MRDFYIKYFDGHIVFNCFGLFIRIKHNKNCINPFPKELGITKEKRDTKIIVSLTSFPQRITTVIETIKSLLNQTLKPDEVILWLAQEQFINKEQELPKELLELKKFGLSIKWCNDIRSYKKLIPTLKLYSDSIIITVDDDIYYAPDTVETLYKSYLEYPNCIHAHRCDWLNILKNGESTEIHWAKTKELYKDSHRGLTSYKNRLTGYGAVLYPPKSLHNDACRADIFTDLLPTHDDVWFWAMACLNGTKTRLVKGYSESISYIPNSQQVGLCKINKKGIGVGLEDAYKIILNKYPQLIDILEAEKES